MVLSPLQVRKDQIFWIQQLWIKDTIKNLPLPSIFGISSCGIPLPLSCIHRGEGGGLVKIRSKKTYFHQIYHIVTQYLASHFEKCSLTPTFSPNRWSLLNFLPKCSVFSLSFLETCFLGQAFLSIAKSYNFIRLKITNNTKRQVCEVHSASQYIHNVQTNTNLGAHLTSRSFSDSKSSYSASSTRCRSTSPIIVLNLVLVISSLTRIWQNKVMGHCPILQNRTDNKEYIWGLLTL